MDKTYGFKLLAEDEDIKEKLESMQAGERSSFIRNALRFYITFGDEFTKMSQNIEEMLSVIKSGKLQIDTSTEQAESKMDDKDKSEEELERMIAESINDILNLNL